MTIAKTKGRKSKSRMKTPSKRQKSKQKVKHQLAPLSKIRPIDDIPHGYNIFDIKLGIMEIIQDMGVDPKKIVDLTQKILVDDICYFPVRHHSISASHSLLHALQVKKPQLVFLEAPADCEHLAPYIVEKQTKPPIAIVSFFKDEKNLLGCNGVFTPDPLIPAKFSAWYPFVSYSPEYNVMLYCYHHNIPIHFIDAPYMNIIKKTMDIHAQANVKGSSQGKKKVKNPTTKKTGSSQGNEKDTQYNHQEEKLFTNSEFFRRFCSRFNVKDMDEAWDLNFEIGMQYRDWKEFREIILFFCMAIRHSISASDPEMEIIRFREQYMQARINEILKKNPTITKKNIMVVTGGLHSVALPRTKALNKRGMKQFHTKNSLVPFSFRRLSKFVGYDAGNAAPSFYHKVWENFKKSKTKSLYPFRQTVLEFTMKILLQSRNAGILISSSDNIAVFQSSLLFASLRHRPEPTVVDLKDSLIMCCIKGDIGFSNTEFLEIMQSRIIGNKLGRITPLYTNSGLSNDFKQRMEYFGIELFDKEQKITLNLHDSKEREISTFLWMLNFLEIGIVSLLEGFDLANFNSDVFHEKWSLFWNPELDIRLNELSNLGSTIEEASLNKLKERMIKLQNDAEKSSELLISSLNMGVNSQFKALKKNFIQSLQLDMNFFHQTKSFENLFFLRRLVQVPTPKLLPEIDHLILKNYYSVATLLPNMGNPPPELVDQVISRLKGIVQIIVTDFTVKLNPIIIDGVINSTYLNCSIPQIAGALIGSRFLLGYISTKEIYTDLSRMSKSVLKQMQMGDYIRGLIEVCEAKIMFERDFIQILTNIIDSLEWNVFLIILPGLKSAFSKLDGKLLNHVMEKIAGIYGLGKLEGEILLVASDEMKTIVNVWDKQVAEILGKWND